MTLASKNLTPLCLCETPKPNTPVLRHCVNSNIIQREPRFALLSVCPSVPVTPRATPRPRPPHLSCPRNKVAVHGSVAPTTCPTAPHVQPSFLLQFFAHLSIRDKPHSSYCAPPICQSVTSLIPPTVLSPSINQSRVSVTYTLAHKCCI